MEEAMMEAEPRKAGPERSMRKAGRERSTRADEAGAAEARACHASDAGTAEASHGMSAAEAASPYHGMRAAETASHGVAATEAASHAPMPPTKAAASSAASGKRRCCKGKRGCKRARHDVICEPVAHEKSSVADATARSAVAKRTTTRRPKLSRNFK
jgi:hypothetical protein